MLKDRVTLFEDKMKESCLRWFGRVQRRVINASVRNSEMIQVEGTKEKVEEDQ